MLRILPPKQLKFSRFFCSLASDVKTHQGTLATSNLIVPGTINITKKIDDLRCRKLHLQENNPICILKNEIISYFNREYSNIFDSKDDFSEKVTAAQNFDDLLIPSDHPSRNLTDTYYFDDGHILRPQTSAHQTEMLRNGYKSFLITGDCYRKDTIDSSHYPIFHQMEGVRIWNKNDITEIEIENDLKNTLNKLVEYLFPNKNYRWLEDYFPFTHPSFEMEVEFNNNNWLEIFGSGIIHKKVLSNCNLSNFHGWAFGLGLERLAMLLFNINDIRQFWSEDRRFLDQFKDKKIKSFIPYSNYPICYKDLSFYINENNLFIENDFMDIIRNIAGDLVENVILIDEFFNKKINKLSKCYRINYRHCDKTLTNDEVNQIQLNVRNTIEKVFDVEIRG